MTRAEKDAWHRRHAVMVAAQLPERREDALAVLRLASQLVTDFLTDPDPGRNPVPVIVLIGGSECA